MKRFILGMIGALLVVGVALAAPARVEKPKLEKAVVQFDEQVKLVDVILKGTYIFIHDDEKMATGEACSSVYTYENGKQGRLVTSFHCIPVAREATDHFTVILSMTNPTANLPELLEYRFAGSPEGHKVPRPADTK